MSTKKSWSICCATLLGLALTAGTATPQETSASGGQDEAAMMAAWQKAMTPGEPHRQLAELEGTWDAEMKMWMDPEGEPMTQRMTAERRMIMDGRFLEETFSGSFMGEPFRGYGLIGFDNVSGRYESLWVDNHSTSMLQAEGEWDEAEDALVFRGVYTDPATGEEKKTRSVWRTGDDPEVYTMYESADGEEWVKTMEIVLTPH